MGQLRRSSRHSKFLIIGSVLSIVACVFLIVSTRLDRIHGAELDALRTSVSELEGDLNRESLPLDELNSQLQELTESLRATGAKVRRSRGLADGCELAGVVLVFAAIAFQLRGLVLFSRRDQRGRDPQD